MGRKHVDSRNCRKVDNTTEKTDETTKTNRKKMDKQRAKAGDGLRDTVEKVRHFCASQNGLEPLPDLKELAQRLNCTYSVLASAIRILLNRGFLAKKGHTIRPVSSESSANRGRWKLLSDSIEKEILSGMRKAGEHLPKKNYFASKFHMSNTTILKAFQFCAEQGLLHKEGRSWVVGKKEREGPFEGSPPVVLVLENRIGRFHSMYTIRTRRFSPSFQEEARKCGIRLTFGLTETWAAPSGTLPRGKEEIMSLVSRLGYRYRGTLIVATKGEFEELDDFVSLLGSTGQPVVWVDTHDTGVSRSTRPKQFRRAHFSEDAALFSALRHLVEYGHRTIGFSYNPRVPWQVCRYQKILDIVRRKGMPLKVVTNPRPKTLWERLSEGSIERNVDRLQHEGPPILAESLNWLVNHVEDFYESVKYIAQLHGIHGEIGLIKCSEHLSRRGLCKEDRAAVFSHVLAVAESPILVPFLRDSAPTAIIAPNDHHARTMYFWLRNAGVQIPRDISVLSFDNYEQFLEIPISTVDFGFGYLGYAALHAILGDIPVKMTQNGDICAQPHVVDRGSVGYPRTGSIEIDFEGIVW